MTIHNHWSRGRGKRYPTGPPTGEGASRPTIYKTRPGVRLLRGYEPPRQGAMQ